MSVHPHNLLASGFESVQPPPSAKRGASLSFASALLALLGWLNAAICQGQDVKIWEFSAYDIEIWYAFDGNVTASELARQEFIHQLHSNLERTYRSAWNLRFQPLPEELRGNVTRDFQEFTLDSLTAGELVLVVSTKHDQAKALRTFEAAIESPTTIYCTEQTKQRLDTAAAQLGIAAETPTGTLLSKIAVEPGGWTTLQERLTSADIAAALVPRSSLPALADSVRPLLTLLPWQIDSLLRVHDKLFFLLIDQDGDDLVVSARELDCPMQFMGPAMSARTKHWSYAARVAERTITRAFAPVARVEDAETKTASLQLRAGGLILDEHNPASVVPGDVMQPIVRRDDRNGVPDLLEPLAWTFAAITASDGVKMEANVYTYSGGPGLQGRKNRRTQRVLLRVRPQYMETDIQLVVRDDGRPLGGSFVYRRDLLSEEFELLGRTDWRGRLTIPVPQAPGGFLPEKIRYERVMAKRAAEAEAAKAAANADNNTNADGNTAPATAPPESTSSPTDDAAAEDETAGDAVDEQVIPLRAALTTLYIKNGDEVLAKLPMVPGLKTLETAKLKDDARRLRAEAFVSGFQGEILDLIGLRNLLAARIQLQLKNQKIDEAKATLEELRRLRNYSEMSEELQAIQRRMLDEKEGPVPLSAKSRIDRMFQTTRDMLQKFMQDNLLTESERAVGDAGG